MYHFILFIQILVILLGFIIIPIILLRKPFHGAICFALFIVGTMIQSYGYITELTTHSVDVIMVAQKFQHFGFAFVNFFFMLFLQVYYNQKVNVKSTLLLVLYNFFILTIVLTKYPNHFYVTSIQYVEEGLFPHAIVKYGNFFYFYMIENVILNVYVIYTVFHHYYTLNIPKRELEHNFLAACFIPCITFILWSTGIFREYNPINASYSFTAIFLLTSIYHHQLFDILHTARDNVFDTMEEALIIIDNDFQILDYNPAASRLFPELSNVDRNTYLYDISPNLYGLFTHKRPMEFQRYGHYYHTQITEVLHKQTVVGYTAWVFDITQSQIHMENLIQLREQAENANRAKSIFLTNMSHEIRTPLNAILGSTDILLNQKIGTQEKGTLLSIKTAGTTLLKMINDILDFSKIESGKLKFSISEYKLTTVVQDVINIISVKLAQKPVMLQVEVQQDLPKYLYGDETRLRQVLINILNNAVKFTNQGSIHLSCTSPDNVSDYLDKITLVFQITDTGIGISKKDQKRIFDSFERVNDTKRNPTEGSGLGLAICEKIVTTLGGSISVESELNMGSTFTIRLPQKVSHEDHTVKSTKTTTPPKLTKSTNEQYSVLIVDDNTVNLQVAHGLLDLYGINIDMATSGKKALELAAMNVYDIIFLDYMMPEMDGIETLKEIRKLPFKYCETVPVIALTANAIIGAEKMFLSSGFDDYLSKPMQLNGLNKILDKWLSINNPTTPNTRTYKAKDQRPEFFKYFAEIYSIDWEYGVANCNGNWNSYFDLLELFCNDGLHQMGELKKAFFDNDLSLYCVLIHAMKSSLVTIGARGLSDLALSLELASKDGDLSFLEDNHQDFITKFTILCYAIIGFMSTEFSK
ncbi:MAG: ATP-binding protein [Clostridiales bacterium]|nr:ATP-binding protein [Clostridiales bacterium]